MLPEPLKIGDVVRFKTIKEMTKEYGSPAGVPRCFAPRMYGFAGQVCIIVSISSIVTDIAESQEFIISAEMLTTDFRPGDAAEVELRKKLAIKFSNTLQALAGRRLGCQTKYAYQLIKELVHAA